MASQPQSLTLGVRTPQHRESRLDRFCLLCLGAGTTLWRPQHAQHAGFKSTCPFGPGPQCACCERYGGDGPSLCCTKLSSFPPSRCLRQLPASPPSARTLGAFHVSDPRPRPFSFPDSPKALGRCWTILQATVTSLASCTGTPTKPECCAAAAGKPCFYSCLSGAAPWDPGPSLSCCSATHAYAAGDAELVLPVAFEFEFEFESRRRQPAPAVPAIRLQHVAAPSRVWSHAATAATPVSDPY